MLKRSKGHDFNDHGQVPGTIWRKTEKMQCTQKLV